MVRSVVPRKEIRPVSDRCYVVATFAASLAPVLHSITSLCPFGSAHPVPIIGMILGNAISAIGISCNAIQKEFAENRDKIETYLAFGATRFEACRPIGKEALKLALLPTVNQMSVIGLISIPGMMTGAIIGGSSVQQAARLQMIIMFSESPLREGESLGAIPSAIG